MYKAAQQRAVHGQAGQHRHLQFMPTAQQQRPCTIHRKQLQPWKQQRQTILVKSYTLKSSSGAELAVDQAKCLVGSSPTADLRLEGPNVAAKHAELLQKGKQVFLKALQGESVFDKTYTWVDESEARPNVSYVLASGSRLAFGDLSQCYTVEFEEPSGANPLLEMMMKGMAASADPSVQKELS